MLANIADARAHMAQEANNPSGVVDLAALHAWGETFQSSVEQYQGIEAAYKSGTKHEFPKEVCVR